MGQIEGAYSEQPQEAVQTPFTPEEAVAPEEAQGDPVAEAAE